MTEDFRKKYDEAKEAYYNGEPLMSDQEFDKLEEDLGLENKGYAGTHFTDEYTVKHPFIMGTLSKIQVKEDKDKNVDWNKLKDDMLSYLKKSRMYGSESWSFEATPKYDGCSFEAVIKLPECRLESVSTRGSCIYGKDIRPWFIEEFANAFNGQTQEWYAHEDSEDQLYENLLVVRGECLVKKKTFDEKYSSFANPRSFVAGVLGQDWTGSPDQIEIRKDLSFVCYDYRVVCDNGAVVELSYSDGDGKLLPGEKASPVVSNLHAGVDFKSLYEKFEKVRKDCGYALDGFVIKPAPHFRRQEFKQRESDEVAIKFKPTIVQTLVKDIEWNVGKSSEYYPVAILEPVKMDGKEVSRVSLHNYGAVRDRSIAPGSVVEISLAGDIIPFLYGVVSVPEDAQEKIKRTLPIDGVTEDHNIHLMKVSSDDERKKNTFLVSARALNVKGVGPKVAEMLYEKCGRPSYLIDLMGTEGVKRVEESLEQSKTRDNIIDALSKAGRSMSLKDAVLSLGMPNCGERTSEIVSEMLQGKEPDMTGMSKEIIISIYEAIKGNQIIAAAIERFVNDIGLKEEAKNKQEYSEKTPVILTGSPGSYGYKTKQEWLTAHPQYIETTSWKECKILFTDDLSSSSGKMQKAKKIGIEILEYLK